MSRDDTKQKLIGILPQIWAEYKHMNYYQLSVNVHPQFSAQLLRKVEKALGNGYQIMSDSKNGYLLIDIWHRDFSRCDGEYWRNDFSNGWVKA